MEKTEPTFIPEWLKKPGAVNGSCSTSNSDERSASRLMQNKSFVNSNGYDTSRPFSSVKTTSSYFSRSSSSNGSGHVRSRSSFGRSQHAKDCDRDTYNSFDKNKSLSGSRPRKDFSDIQGTTFSKYDRNRLRHSQSGVSEKQGDTWHKKVITDSSTASVSNTNGLHSKSNLVGRASKLTFDRNFPSLAEERSVPPEVGRIPSPGLSSATQSVSISSSAITSDENLTSVLAEVPTGMLSMQQVSSSSIVSGASGTASNLNMAEAVALGHNRVQIAPQLSTETQRLEELAIKQSRLLIPVIPSMPKTLVSSSSDKQKAKAGLHLVPSSSAVNRANGPTKVDTLKPSLSGKLHVLKPVREKNGGKTVSSTLAATPVSSGSASTKAATNGPDHESKPAMNPLEKRPSSQARSRNDFFNSVRKKSMANSSSLPELDTSTTVSSPVPAEIEVVNTSKNHDDTACVVNDYDDDTRAGDKIRDELATSDPIIFPEEEETAFLRSLGWEENADESALTEEEISAFFRDVAKYINSNPSLQKIPQAIYPKFSSPFNSHIVGITSIPSGLSSSDAKLES